MQRLFDLVASAFTAHSDSSSNPFLNPNAAPVAAAAASSSTVPTPDQVAPLVVEERAARLPNPGKFAEYAREARVSLEGPQIYDGGKFILAKRFVNEKKLFAMVNTFHVGSTESQEPATYELDLNYQDESGALITKYLPAVGVLSGQVYTKAQGNEVQVQFNIVPPPHAHAGSVAMHVPGRGCESSITATSHGTLSLAHMQSLTRSFAAGIQLDHAWKEGKSLFSGAMRYAPTKNDVFALGMSPVQGMKMFDATYARTFHPTATESVTLSSAARVIYPLMDSTAQVGLDMTRNESNLQMAIDSHFNTTWSYTERVAGDLLSMTLNAQLNRSEQAYKFGIGFECNL